MEIMETVKDSRYSSMWHIHGLATVLGTRIQSVYPEFGGFTVRKYLNRPIAPRTSKTSGTTD